MKLEIIHNGQVIKEVEMDDVPVNELSVGVRLESKMNKKTFFPEDVKKKYERKKPEHPKQPAKIERKKHAYRSITKSIKGQSYKSTLEVKPFERPKGEYSNVRLYIHD